MCEHVTEGEESREKSSRQRLCDCEDTTLTLGKAVLRIGQSWCLHS